MKSLLIAGLIAVGSVAAVGAPAQAASVVVTTRHTDWHHRHWRHHMRHCRVVVRHYWHHGHRVVRRTRVCD